MNWAMCHNVWCLTTGFTEFLFPTQEQVIPEGQSQSRSHSILHPDQHLHLKCVDQFRCENKYGGYWTLSSFMYNIAHTVPGNWKVVSNLMSAECQHTVIWCSHKSHHTGIDSQRNGETMRTSTLSDWWQWVTVWGKCGSYLSSATFLFLYLLSKIIMPACQSYELP